MKVFVYCPAWQAVLQRSMSFIPSDITLQLRGERMPVACIDWESAHLYGDAWISHHRLRHRIFVERQEWDVPTCNGLEYDQFDTPAAKYILWLDGRNRARGVVRLIPTTRPYMVKTLWPQLLSDAPIEDPTVWEATRFGCDRDLSPDLRRQVIAELICACQEFGTAMGLRAYLGVMPLAIFKRVIEASGCPVRRLGAAIRVGCHSLAAASIEVSPAVLETVRARSGLAGTDLHKNWASAVSGLPIGPATPSSVQPAVHRHDGHCPAGPITHRRNSMRGGADDAPSWKPGAGRPEAV